MVVGARISLTTNAEIAKDKPMSLGDGGLRPRDGREHVVVELLENAPGWNNKAELEVVRRTTTERRGLNNVNTSSRSRL